MSKRLAVPVISVLGMIIAALSLPGCARHLEERQVRARLVDQLHLQNDQLRIRAVSGGDPAVAALEYGGVVASVRFRYRDGVWVIEAVNLDGRWEPGDREIARFAQDLGARARARETADVMPRYARTLKLLVAWSTLLSTDCGSLPASRTALLNLHAMWHRTLFVTKGGEFAGELHNGDLFFRDAWLRPMRVTYSYARLEVQSGGADGRFDTSDDVQMVYSRVPVKPGIELCGAHYTLPSGPAAAMTRPDAPATWNCASLIDGLKKANQLELR